MKKIIVLSLMLIIQYSIFNVDVEAQQLPQYTQYLFNDYVVNPAIAGTQPYYVGKSNHRYQWIGITDAPRTYVFSLQGPLKNNKVGIGGLLYTDITGPTRRTGVQGTYAYHLTLTEDIKLSLGLSVGVLQFMVDGAKVTMKEDNDMALVSDLRSVLTPDAGLGVYLYADKFYFGASVPQLLQNKVKFYETDTKTLNKLVNHYYIFGGYKYAINEDIDLEPSVMLKFVSPVPLQPEFSIKGTYQEKIWAAVSYRLYDAASVMIGYTFKENLLFGYSYDITTSNLKNYSSGSHEIMLGIRFMGYTAPTVPSYESENETPAE